MAWNYPIWGTANGTLLHGTWSIADDMIDQPTGKLLIEAVYNAPFTLQMLRSIVSQYGWEYATDQAYEDLECLSSKFTQSALRCPNVYSFDIYRDKKGDLEIRYYRNALQLYGTMIVDWLEGDDIL